MTSFAAITEAPGVAVNAPRSLVDFLRRELAPYPGRSVATGRIVVACVTVLVLCMTLRVPEAQLAVWAVFKIALEESGETLLAGIASLVMITIGIALSLVLLIVAMDQPWLRFCLIGVMAALALFLRRTFVIGAAGFLLGLIWTVVLTFPDFIPAPEQVIHLTLWVWPVFGLGIAGAVAANLLIAPTDPAKLLRKELVTRVESAEAAIARRIRTSSAMPESLRFAMSGVARLERLLRSAEIMHPAMRRQHRQSALLVTLVDRLVTASAALDVLTAEPTASERARLESIAEHCARLRRALEEDRTPPPFERPLHIDLALPADHRSAIFPVVVELERVVTMVEDAHGSEDEVAGNGEGGGLFIGDAFTNPEYVRYALKGALAVVICYLLQSAVDWPGIRTCMITCMIVGLTSEGATIQKGTLRIAGTIVGGALGFVSILFLIPGMESITSLVLLVAAGSAVAAWVYLGSARISYVGVQIAFAFFVCVIQDFGPSWYFFTIRDRLVGILLGNTVISLVFLTVWPVRAGTAMWASFASALRALADLATVDVGSDGPTVVAGRVHRLRLEAYRHFAAIEQSADENAFEWSASESEARDRDRVGIATAEARAIFAIQLPLASQGLPTTPSEIPAPLLACTRQIDVAMADTLDAIADRASDGTIRELPDLQTPLSVATAIARAELPRIKDSEVSAAVDGRLALYRELVSRLERLGSRSFAT